MRRWIAAANAAVLVISSFVLLDRHTDGPGPLEVLDAAAVPAATTTTTAWTAPVPTDPPPTDPPPTEPPPTAPATVAGPATSAVSRARPVPIPAPVPAAAPAPRLARNAPITPGTVDPYRGFGAWIDVFDWSREFTNGRPAVRPADIDRMADLGVQTLYVQAAKHQSANDVVDIDLLRPLIDRAHQRGMAVVVWYLPTLEDPGRDLQRTLAIARLGVEGVGVDIESRHVADHAERSRRLVDLSRAVREHLPGVPLAGIVMPPVVMDVINPGFWPGFPWGEIAPYYDVWMPMSYWSMRRADSGYRDAYRYTAENIDRMRANLGLPGAVVHPIGGLGDGTGPAEADGFHRAAAERGSIGGSIYDYRITREDAWPVLARFRV